MTDQPTPSRRAGLRDQLINALGQIDTIPPVAHRRQQADNVLAVLYREWPWLRAEAEEAADPSLLDRIAAAIRNCPARYPDDIATAVHAAIQPELDRHTRVRALLAEVLGQFQPLRPEHNPTGEPGHWQARVLPYEMDAWQKAAAGPTATGSPEQS